MWYESKFSYAMFFPCSFRAFQNNYCALNKSLELPPIVSSKFSLYNFQFCYSGSLGSCTNTTQKKGRTTEVSAKKMHIPHVHRPFFSLCYLITVFTLMLKADGQNTL